VKPNCTSGPLPTIRLIGPPEHGKVSVKKVNVNATNYKQCLALEVPDMSSPVNGGFVDLRLQGFSV
jgi:hypothetical protein